MNFAVIIIIRPDIIIIIDIITDIAYNKNNNYFYTPVSKDYTLLLTSLVKNVFRLNGKTITFLLSLFKK